MEPRSITASFLFTDIEGSTRLWEEDRAGMSDALAAHDRIVRGAVESCGGSVFATGGDGFAAAFGLAPDALKAALDAQVGLGSIIWGVPIAVRMAVHTGGVEERGGDYFGPPLNRCARLMAAAHGGQILCSGVSASLAAGQLPDGARLADLGEHRLRDLSEPEQVFQLAHPRLRFDFPPLRSLDSFPGNLPVQSTTFVGRDDAMAELTDALVDARVLTLTGVGGVGKTRLALQVAAEVVPRFRDGAWLIELAAVSASDAIDETVALALGVHQRPGNTMRQSVVDFLRDKVLLMVLDNCEHLVGAVASLVEATVTAAPGLRILATSREGLAVAGEQITTVRSLHVPGSDATPDAVLGTEAARLFVDRAKESDSGFAAGSEDAQAITELCRRLDGIPLAIELAAARVRGMTPAEIAGHLDRRFRLLTRGRRTAAARHQTLRNTIDWSYDLLDEPEKTVLRRLGVFRGGFALDAAEAVVAGDDLDTFEVVDLLTRLVDKSLVVAERRSGVSRYHLLETIHEYAWERLDTAGELDDVAVRHARYYRELAVRAGAGLEGPAELEWRCRVEDDLENLRGALRWAIEVGDVDSALTEVEALNTVGSLLSPPFGLTALEAARMEGADQHELQPTALAAVCMTYTQQGDVERAMAFADAAQTSAKMLWGNSPRHAKLRCRLGGCLATAIAYSGDVERLLELARNGLDDARLIRDRFETCRALILLTSVLEPDHNEEAILYGEEALTLAKHIGNPSYLAWAPMMLAGRLASIDPARAAALFDEAVRSATAADNEWARSMALMQLATAQLRQRDHLAAGRSLLEMALIAHAHGDHGTVQSGIGLLACVLAVHGDEETALVAGSWSGRRGFHATGTAPQYVYFDVASYLALREAQTEAALRAIDQHAETMNEAQMLDVVRRCIDALTDRDA